MLKKVCGSLLVFILCLMSSRGELFKTTVDIIKDAFFDAETHKVETRDHYVLTLHRIVNPYSTGPKKPVLLMHGLVASSSLFVISAPEPELTPDYARSPNETEVGNNLGFVLSRLGYDVWMGNFRGNKYSQNHTRMSVKDSDFWAFSLDQFQEFDLPAMIKYILTETNSTSLGYVGHSQGSQTMFALLSERPHFADVVKPFIALAPVSHLNHPKSLIVKYFNNFIFRYVFGSKGPLSTSGVIQRLSRTFCTLRDPSVSANICGNVIFSIIGYSKEQLNASRLNLYLHHLPDGTSNWNLLHLLQIINTKRFQKFDRGSFENMQIYDQSTPPEYDLTRITSKDIALIYGKNDLLTPIEDQELLKSKLKYPPILDYQVPDPNWNHLDFFWGKDAGKYVNAKVVEVLAKY